jgi:hypothetical protein
MIFRIFRLVALIIAAFGLGRQIFKEIQDRRSR